MTKGDADQFSELITSVADLYGREMPRATMRLYWAALRQYSWEEVRHAFSAHVQCKDRGRFMPKPADILLAIEGPDPEPADVIEMARAADTKMGVIFRTEIGSWNLANMRDSELRSYAKRCMRKLPEYRQQLRAGTLPAHIQGAIERLLPSNQLEKQDD